MSVSARLYTSTRFAVNPLEVWKLTKQVGSNQCHPAPLTLHKTYGIHTSSVAAAHSQDPCRLETRGHLFLVCSPFSDGQAEHAGGQVPAVHQRPNKHSEVHC